MTVGSAQPTAGEGLTPCPCAHRSDSARFIVLTGGPSAGKTAVLDIVRQRLCSHVYVVEESASIVFGGGFPRDGSDVAQRAAQRAIFHVQRELEFVAEHRPETSLAVCDRGTLDGLAYWPGAPEDFLRQVGTTLDAELARYSLVIHLRTPGPQHYSRSNALRIETAEQARRIDERIHDVWASHPRRIEIQNNKDFFQKAQEALAVIEAELAECCRPRHGLTA